MWAQWDFQTRRRIVNTRIFSYPLRFRFKVSILWAFVRLSSWSVCGGDEHGAAIASMSRQVYIVQDMGVLPCSCLSAFKESANNLLNNRPKSDFIIFFPSITVDTMWRFAVYSQDSLVPPFITACKMIILKCSDCLRGHWRVNYSRKKKHKFQCQKGWVPQFAASHISHNHVSLLLQFRERRFNLLVHHLCEVMHLSFTYLEWAHHIYGTVSYYMRDVF